MTWWDSWRRRRMIERSAERHLSVEYGVYIYWTDGPYTDGTTYQQAWVFQPRPGDRVGAILASGIGPTKAAALLALHKRLKGRPDVFERWVRRTMGQPL